MTVLLDATPSRTPSAARLLAAADADLDGLGDRLHDGVLQALVVARYACDAVARGADPALARDAVQDALVALRREVWLLRPRSDLGLVRALGELSAQLATAGRPGLLLDLDRAADARLGPEQVGVAYRLVQALLGRDLALAVRLDGRGRLCVGAALADPEVWSLRAAAVDAELRAERACTLLLLTIPEDTP